VHEVLHMCLALTHLSQRLYDDAEEDLVRAVTPYLAQCITDVAKARRPRG
jgi:hypothetical protein